MIKFAKDSINKKFNVKGFGDWLNASITNRAKFVYSAATFSIFIRYVLYSFHQGSWLPNSVTFYSAVFSYTVAALFYFLFLF